MLRTVLEEIELVGSYDWEAVRLRGYLDELVDFHWHPSM